MEKIICKSCGAPNEVEALSGDWFCEYCGNPIELGPDRAKFRDLFSKADDAWDRKDFDDALKLYEQIVALRDSNNVGFEQLVHLALESGEEDSYRIHYQANQQGISMEDPYIYVLFQHDHKDFDIRTKRNAVMDLFLHCGMEQKGRMAFLSRTEGMILFRAADCSGGEEKQVRAVLEEFQSKMSRKYEGMTWTIAASYEPRRLSEIRACVEKGRKTLKIGRIAFPEKRVLDYGDLGILTWLEIPDEELKKLLEEFLKVK